jgi:DNA-binding NarL/FixJ family response regulator
MERLGWNMAQSPKKPTVIVADDHPGNLERVCEALSMDFEVVGKVQDGLAALHTAMALQPDIVILDFSMPKMDGIQTARELRKRDFRSAILFLTIHADDDYMEVLRELRAGYVSKVRMQTNLVPAVRAELRKYQ